MRENRLLHLFIGSLFTALLGHLSAEENADISKGFPNEVRISFEALVDRTSLPADEVLRFTLRLSWPGDQDRFEFLWPEEPACQGLVIVGTSTANEQKDEGIRTRAARELVYLLKPVRAGRGWVPPLTLTYRDLIVGKEFSLRSEGIEVEILPPRAVGRIGSGWFFPWGAGIVILLTIFFGVLFFVRDRRKPKRVVVVPAEGPEDIALREVEEAKEARYSGGKEYCSAVASALRRYLATKYEIRTKEVTTYDLINILRLHKVDEGVISQIEAILTTCDLVKFAQHTQASLERIDVLIRDFLKKQLTQVDRINEA